MRARSVYHPASRLHWRLRELVPKLVDLEQAGVVPHSLVGLSAGTDPRCAALFGQGFWLVQHFILEFVEIHNGSLTSENIYLAAIGSLVHVACIPYQLGGICRTSISNIPQLGRDCS